LLKAGKAPTFRKNWEGVVLEETLLSGFFPGRNVLEDVKMYTDWRLEIMSMYKRLAH
jgi:hypothetical protein